MIYFVRHGKTDWNNLKKMQGVVDIPLNAEGFEHAKNLSKSLKDIKFDKVFCSTLTRTKQTLEIIASEHNLKLDIEYLDCLKEIDYKQYAGKSKDSFDYNGFWDFSKKESFDNFFEFSWPIAKFIYNVLLKDYKNKDVLIVSHGGVAKVFELFLSQNSLLPQDIGKFLPKNLDCICYDLKYARGGKSYVQNINNFGSKNNCEDTVIITPNIVSQKVKSKNLTVLSDMPKLYEREAVILIDQTSGGQIAVFDFKNTKEIKLPGWRKTELSIEKQILRRTGYKILKNSLKPEQMTIEITFNNPNGEVVFSKYYSAVIDNKFMPTAPDFNKKEQKEGAKLRFFNLFSLSIKLKETINKISSLDLEDDDFRPIESKQSIWVRDRAVIESFITKILINYTKN